MIFFREAIQIEGNMPERALLRLRRANIGIYGLKKTQKNQILFTVKKQDKEKVFAIYPNVCYNISVHTPYTAKSMGAVGLWKVVKNLKKRIGLLLGCLFFFGAVAYADRFIFKIELTGADVYQREVRIALEEGGIKTFSPFKRGNVDAICAEILKLDGIEYCSVRKCGYRAIVELQVSPFADISFESGDMQSKRKGELLSLTVLRGTPLKRVGEVVSIGETLVGGWIEKDEGNKIPTQAIARASIACSLDWSIEADSEEEAFAKAYLLLELGEGDIITEKEIAKEGKVFHVKISYIAIERINM